MNTKTNIPKWFNEGPHDIEYRTYKLKGAISNIKGMLNSGQLIPALFEIDDTLDYLYRYDSVRITHNPNPILPTDQIVSGFEIPGLELFFTEEDELETDNVLDSILDEAIDSFEELHSMCRERWRLIENGTTCVYVPAKKYFLNDGFVFIRTADNMLHVYHFIKPNKYFTKDWKKFNMTHIQTEKWTDNTYFSRIEELVSKDSDKIIIRTDCKTDTILKNNAIGVINQMVFSMLHRDYSF